MHHEEHIQTISFDKIEKMTTHHFRIVYKRGERVTCSQLKMELR